MVSPNNPGSVHSYESLMKAIVHELAHTIVLNIRNKGLIGLLNWLNEGYAYYEAGQLTEEEIISVQNNLVNNTIPSWQELQVADTTQFGDLGGYGISATIVMFIVEKYGYQKLKRFIIEPENIESIFNISEDEFDSLWRSYLLLYSR